MRFPSERLSATGAARVALRRWRTEDLEPLYRAVSGSLGHLRPWADWAADGYDRDDAAGFIAASGRDWGRGEVYNYAILAADATVGSAGLMTRVGDGGLEIGYWLAADRTGCGLATAAAELLTEEAFRIGARRTVIKHDERNLRSAAIPRRLGYTVQARIPGEPGVGEQTRTTVVWVREP